MQSLREIESDSATHCRRIAALSQKLAARLHSSTDNVFDLCSDFDEAVEFATLEDESIAEAIATFVEERWDVTGCRELACLCGYGSAVIDITSMTLPVMPRQACRLLRTSNLNTSPAELGDIAASDPVLAGKLLSAANSAIFGSRFEIVRLVDAVMRLGIPEARRVLLAQCFARLFGSKPLQDLWKHSQEVAWAACDMATLVGFDTEMAYLAGLLHDIGRLGFLKLPRKLRIPEQDWLACGFPVVYAEAMSYGLDHAVLGGKLLRAWELPQGIADAVSFHHRPEHSDSRLTAVLTLAEDLTTRTANADSEDLWAAMRRSSACLRAGITLDQLDVFQLSRLTLHQSCG
jgi:putative nucleotidyltransferase with HDIG domain